jgi:hypothetical protein
MEALRKMITATVDRGLLSSFFVGSRPPVVNISHLLFADDTLVFCGTNPNRRYLHVLLLFFEAVFGLKVNLAKSVLVPVGELAGILGCGTSSLPLKYLGIPLRASFKAKYIWDGIMEKMERWLDSWKMMYLSKGGRGHPYQEHTFQLTYVLIVPLPHPC